MSQHELLMHVLKVLDEAAIPYVITGSTASSMQGQPRATHDIDVIVGILPSKVAAVAGGFAHGGMFNVLDNEGADKVDFWILKPDAFDQSMFRRRITVEFRGQAMNIPQPEDTILSKLRWAKQSGGSEKQMKDCIGVYEVNFTNLDQDYLDEWAAELGVEELLARVRRESQAAP